MSPLQKLAALVLVVLLAATGYGLWATTTAPGSAAPRWSRPGAATAATAASAMPVIDQETLLAARRLARLPASAEEQPLAQSAVQVADHELDLSFSAAMRPNEA